MKFSALPAKAPYRHLSPWLAKATAGLFLLLLLAAPAGAQKSQAPNTLKSPDDFLPYRLGEQFTPHYLLTQYFEQLAASSPATMKLERYGKTTEDRPLQIAFFSSPANIARLDIIRQNNLRQAGLLPGVPEKGPAIAIVWLSMSVHGNEPSGSECSMELAYRLASQTDPKIQEWLKNTVVIIDPSLNPDGYDRYTHWYRGVSNRLKNPNPEAREHREPWPRGRSNHYQFDLNRDWAWATQTETQQRLKIYHDWMPHVHADVHEQEIDNPYYFAPAAEPMHDYITKWQREFQTEIGESHAHYFDANGWLYFTQEVFDLFYPSYGDTYPMFNGAIGMTYEQAGNTSAGRAIETAFSDTLTLHDRILHHLTTCLSTIEVTSREAAKVVENFHEYYRRAAEKPQGQYLSFVVRSTNPGPKLNELCALLDRHQIRYGLAGATTTVKAYDYVTGQETNAELQPNDLVISAFQPHGVLVQVLFEPEARLSDSLTYDITSWALPYARGLEAYALKTRLEPKKAFEPIKSQEVMLAASPYAWCVHRRSMAEALLLAELVGQEVKVRYARKPFSLADQQFEAGALVITRADNHAHEADLDALVKAAAAKANVPLYPIFSGWSGKGPNLGSDAFSPIEMPRVAVVYGDDVDVNSYGHTWYFFEQTLGYPLTPVPLDNLQKLHLHAYNTLVFPDGNYNLTDSLLRKLKDWVGEGGKIIGFDGGAKAFADKEGFDLKFKAEDKKDSTDLDLAPYQSRERSNVSDQLPGAIIKAKADPGHPLAFGLPNYYFTLKTTPNAYELSDKMTNVVWVGDTLQSTGFIGSHVRPRLKNSPVVAVQKMGSGEVVYFVDNPLFRAFWKQGEILFANALFY